VTNGTSERHFFHPRLWGAAAAIWTAAVFALALTPNAQGGWLTKTLGDKVLHGFAFFVGCFLWARTLQVNSRWPRITTVIVGALISVAIGFAVEAFQIYIPSRQADMWDILADCLGVLPALTYLTLVEVRKRRQPT
jgi:VanZ family protein